LKSGLFVRRCGPFRACLDAVGARTIGATMDTLTATTVSREDVLEAMAEVMARQARVARSEAALAAARRHLGESVSRLSRLYRAHGERLELSPLAALALESIAASEGALDGALEGLARLPAEERAGTLRERIIAVMEASPEEVYTPARLSPAVGSPNRDSIRNTLLVLAAKGKIEKVGAGQYRARSRAG
jgi:hypothetical protein